MSPALSGRNNTPGARLLLCAFLLGLGLVWAPRSPGENQPATAESAVNPGLERIHAKDLLPLLGRHRGKVVLVNFWATWCGPCIREIPALIRLRESMDPASFVLVAISLDDRANSRWRVSELIEGRFPKWSSYLSAEIEDYLMVEELDPFWPGVMPSNYVIGPDGAIKETLVGGHSEERLAEAVRAAMPENETEPEEGR